MGESVDGRGGGANGRRSGVSILNPPTADAGRGVGATMGTGVWTGRLGDRGLGCWVTKLRSGAPGYWCGDSGGACLLSVLSDTCKDIEGGGGDGGLDDGKCNSSSDKGDNGLSSRGGGVGAILMGKGYVLLAIWGA